MKPQQFPFRRDDGSIVWLGFEHMMAMDPQGFIQLEDGQWARRARDLEQQVAAPTKPPAERAEAISDSLGFIGEALPDMRDQLKQSGVRGVEFKEDPEVPGFYNVHCSTQATKMRYANSRGLHDANSRNGAGSLGEYDLKTARELVERKHLQASH